MPVLNWIGKDAVVRHDAEVPFRLLHDVPELAGGDADSGNLIVEGDNLLALKALLPHYGGQVKCIYIDPPYNTGQDERDSDDRRNGWVYNDNVDSPQMREWLGKVVGVEAEDLCRHDKWRCMMYPRLKLLKRFLRDDGVIFASIDDIELANLRMLFDEIFGIGNRVGTIIWKNVTDNNPTQIATEHEYVLCYARDKGKLPKEWKAVSLAVKTKLLEIGEQFIRDYPDREQRQATYTRWYRENRAQLWPFEDYKFIDAGGIYTGMRAVHNPGKEGYRVDCWIRNVERKPSSFSLPTSTDRFYPDFLIRLENGGIIAAEYKGAHLASGKGSDEKKRIGELWERRGGGKCAFAWVEKENWASLQNAAMRCAAVQGGG